MELETARKSLSRPEAIDRMRKMLIALTHEDECACATTARFSITCRGLARLTDQDLKKRYDWIARTRPKATREELEKLVTQYHLGRQEATGASLCCDIETKDHCGCDGWNQFDNATLERFYLEMMGENVRIG